MPSKHPLSGFTYLGSLSWALPSYLQKHVAFVYSAQAKQVRNEPTQKAPWVVSRHDQIAQCTRNKPKYDLGYSLSVALCTPNAYLYKVASNFCPSTFPGSHLLGNLANIGAEILLRGFSSYSYVYI